MLLIYSLLLFKAGSQSTSIITAKAEGQPFASFARARIISLAPLHQRVLPLVSLEIEDPWCLPLLISFKSSRQRDLRMPLSTIDTKGPSFKMHLLSGGQWTKITMQTATGPTTDAATPSMGMPMTQVSTKSPRITMTGVHYSLGATISTNPFKSCLHARGLRARLMMYSIPLL